MSGESGSKKAIWVVLAILVGIGFAIAEFGGEDDGLDTASTNTSTATYSGSGFGVDPPVLSGPEEDQLVKRLKAAYDVQGVCYGWRINDTESGSYLGAPSTLSGDPPCEKYVEFVADYTYNSTDEEFTAVTYDINSSLANPPTKADLTAMGVGTDELLDEPNVYVTDAIGALPMLVAEKGEAPAVPAPQEQNNTRGETLDRTIEWRWLWVALAIALLGLGLLWLIVGVVRAARDRQTSEPPQSQETDPQEPNQGMGSQ
jgi:hypothetical protein